MVSLFNGVYIASIEHTDYWYALALFATVFGAAAIIFSWRTLLAAGNKDKSWRKLAIVSMILISVFAAFTSEAVKHSNDIGGYTVYITSDADVNELLSQYRVVGVNGDIWAIKPIENTKDGQ